MTALYLVANTTDTLHDHIAQRAHDLWDGAGRPHGRSTDFWHEAWAEMRVEIDDADPLKAADFSR